MENFSSFNLPDKLLSALATMDFVTPTPIQQQAIPPALEGRDILGSAQTGTGKTGAFGIPLVAHLLAHPQETALVLTPTRELATQVITMLSALCGKTLSQALLIGGDPFSKQFQALKRGPRLVVGTPGRVNDHLLRGTLSLRKTQFLVLDETDRMLDMGFSVQIEKILKFIPQSRQTLLFSATFPKNIVGLAEKYLKDPVRISIGHTSTPAQNITQELLHVYEEDKYTALVSQLEKREGSVIVFVKTKWGADKIASRLRQDDQNADAIHGDLRQHKRDKVISGFRAKKYRILVATDIAARGLDIPHIEHVINYDMPQCPEDYIHRIGRTARAGAQGSALCLVTPSDKGKWRAISRLMKLDSDVDPFPQDRERSPSRKRPSKRPFRSHQRTGGFRSGSQKTLAA